MSRTSPSPIRYVSVGDRTRGAAFIEAESLSGAAVFVIVFAIGWALVSEMPGAAGGTTLFRVEPSFGEGVDSVTAASVQEPCLGGFKEKMYLILTVVFTLRPETSVGEKRAFLAASSAVV